MYGNCNTTCQNSRYAACYVTYALNEDIYDAYIEISQKKCKLDLCDIFFPYEAIE